MQTMLNIFVSFLFLISSLNKEFNEKHPVHLSVSNLEYIANNEVFSLSVRVFTDDLQAVINKEQNSDIVISNENLDDVKKHIDKYIHDHIKIYLNKKEVFHKTVSYKIKLNTKENTTEVFYRMKQKIPRKVTLKNTLFSGFFRDQKNLLIFTCENTQKAFKFDRNNTEEEFMLK